MLHFIFALLVGASMANQEPATVSKDSLKVFSCQSRHSMFDPDFQQGSEIYVDVYYEPVSKKTAVSYWPADAPRFALYPASANTRSVYHSKSSVVLEWETTGWSTYVSMQYLGGPWGFATEVPEEYDDANYAGTDLEIWCDETENTSEFLKQIEE